MYSSGQEYMRPAEFFKTMPIDGLMKLLGLNTANETS